MSLKRTSQFTVDWKSQVHEQRMHGTFTVKKLSVKDQAKVRVRQVELNGGLYCVLDDNGNPTGKGVDLSTESLNYMIAYLEVALEQKPIWFDLNELADEELLMHIFQEAMKFENSFRGREGSPASNGGGLAGGSITSLGANGGTPDASSSNTAVPPARLVGGNVPFAVE